MIVRNSPFPTPINTPPNQKTDATTENKPKNLSTEAPKEAESQESEEVKREQKIKDIKQEVDNGTYKIDINKSADKMAQDLLVEVKVYK